MIQITLGAWNIRTLLDRKKANRPDRRTALIASELNRYNLPIVALSETRFAGESSLTEKGAGYTFFWSGRKEEEKRESGVGFAIKSSLVNKLDKPPKGINDRLMSLRLPLTNKKYATIFSVYAPTMTNPEEVKSKFYEELTKAISEVPSSDKLLILGDFNARVGQDHLAWPGVLGTQGIGKCNTNGLLLLETCAAHELLITNTVFQLPTRQKTTWMHPRSKHWHMIDYVITRQRDRQDVRVTKAMCGAECWTDHRLIVTRLKLRICPSRRPQGTQIQKKLDVGRLTDPSVRELLASEMTKAFEGLTSTQDVEKDWETLRDLTYSCAIGAIGPVVRRHKDWFDENNTEVRKLLDEKLKAHLACVGHPDCDVKKAAFRSIRGKVQSELRKMQDSWLSERADEIQGYADRNDSKNFYSALKAIYGPSASSSPTLLSSDGSTLLTDQDKVLERWAEHFSNVLNRPSNINDEAISNLPQVPTNEEMDRPPDIDEVSKAAEQLSCGKAPGKDGIPAEIYKFGGQTLLLNLTNLFNLIWSREKLPQELKDASIIHLYKRKGNRHVCDNHRGISLLSIAGKILARVLLNRLNRHLEDGLLPESQCGFRSGRGTVDMIFAARQLQEKAIEQHVELYTTFVDLTKAFDTVSREGLWKIMAKFGCPNTFIAITREFHEGMQAQVQDNGAFSKPFPVSNGVKQGCVLAPTLFSMMFSAMLMNAFKDDPVGIDFRYRFDGGGLFKPTRLKAPTKVQVNQARDFLFADDCALNASCEEDMQASMDSFAVACQKFGLTISTAKTEVLHQPAPGAEYTEPVIHCNGVSLVAADKFTYLGSTLSRTASLDDEIAARLSKASSAFGRLRSSTWDRRGISTSTKIKVYNAVVLPSLLYGCETWTVYNSQAKKLNTFHMKCLRKILNVSYEERIPDTEILERAQSESIFAKLKKSQLRWAGHVSRMDDSRIPKQLLYGELCVGKRHRGRPKLRYKDVLKQSLNDCDIDPKEWEYAAKDRPAWRHKVQHGAHQYESVRIEEAKEKRAKRKAAASMDVPPSITPTPSDPLPLSSFSCPYCEAVFVAQTGLYSHLRTHHHHSVNWDNGHHR